MFEYKYEISSSAIQEKGVMVYFWIMQRHDNGEWDCTFGCASHWFFNSGGVANIPAMMVEARRNAYKRLAQGWEKALLSGN